MFKLTNNPNIVETTQNIRGVPSGSHISNNHRYWRHYEAWLDEGNTPLPADPRPAPPTNSELIDLAGPVLVAYLKSEAKRREVPVSQIRNDILAEM